MFYKNLMKSYVNFGSVYGYHTTKEACPSVIERKVEQSRKKYEGTNGLQYPCLTLIVPARGTTMVHPYAQKKNGEGIRDWRAVCPAGAMSLQLQRMQF